MKSVMVKKIFALCVALMMIAGVMTMPAFAAESEEVVEEPAANVIFWAEDMEGKLEHANDATAYGFTTVDGLKVLSLGIKPGATGNDPYLGFVFDQTYSTEIYKYVTLVVKTNLNRAANFSIYYGTDGTGGTFVGGGRVAASYNNVVGWQILTFDMTDSEKWTGELSKVRFDYFEGSEFNDQQSCQLLAMVLSADVESAYDAAYEIGYKIYPPVQSFSDFTTADLESVGKDTHNTSVTAVDGNLFYIPTGDMKDPSAWFYYNKLTAARGVERLTTDDFRYTVIRYRSTLNIAEPRMQLFVLTGSANSLMDMIRIEGTYDCHYGLTNYDLSKTYKAVVVDLAQTDGLAKNTRLMYGWQGRGNFSGIRFDWCNEGTAGSYFEVSDFLFYADRNDADGFTSMINTMNLINPEDMEDWEETYETEHIVMPWETEDSTEETVPDFPEDSTETDSEAATEIGSEVSGEDTTEVIEDDTQESESNNQGSIGGDIGGDIGGEIDISGGGDEPPVPEGSQAPFLIACIALAGLSVASIVTVIVIRARERM